MISSNLTEEGYIVRHQGKVDSFTNQRFSACNLAFSHSSQDEDVLNGASLRQRVACKITRYISQRDAVLDFLGKVIKELHSNTNAPNIMDHGTASKQHPFTISLDGNLSDIPHRISIYLSNVIKHLGRTLSPSRAGLILDIFSNSRNRNAGGKVLVRIIDGRIDSHVDPSIVRLNQSRRTTLPSRS